MTVAPIVKTKESSDCARDYYTRASSVLTQIAADAARNGFPGAAAEISDCAARLRIVDEPE